MLGIIPAAGKAERFSGIYKELLPVADKQLGFTSALHSAIKRVNQMGAREAIVITNEEKIAVHAHALRATAFPVSFVLQRGDELWGAISSTFYRGEDSLLIMPDTIFTPVEQIPRTEHVISFGTFETGHPERYSVLRNGSIYTKQPWPHQTKNASAWGCVYWRHAAVDFWKANHYNHYDQAFQAAIDAFPSYGVFSIMEYYDIGSYEQYCSYLHTVHSVAQNALQRAVRDSKAR